MRTNETNTTETSTLVRRFITRLVDPSPARYSAPVALRTFGRVKLTDAVRSPGEFSATASPLEVHNDVEPACVRPRPAA